MRRFFPLLGLALALGVLPAAGAALAGERGGWSRGGHEHGGAERGGPERGGPERGRGGPAWGRGGERGPPPGWRGGGRIESPEGPPPDAYYAPPPGAYTPRHGYGMRRGGYLPPGVGGAYVPDPGRYRLRPPPRGYTWVRVGNAFLLMNMATGQIFDMIAD
jgi:Ni/Co efflux regulator RcnB